MANCIVTRHEIRLILSADGWHQYKMDHFLLFPPLRRKQNPNAFFILLIRTATESFNCFDNNILMTGIRYPSTWQSPETDRMFDKYTLSPSSSEYKSVVRNITDRDGADYASYVNKVRFYIATITVAKIMIIRQIL